MRSPRPVRDALGRELEHGVEVGARELGVRGGRGARARRARPRRTRPRRRPRRRSAGRGCRAAATGGERRVEPAARAPRPCSAAHSTSSSRVIGIEDALGHAAPRVVGAAHALQERGDGARRAHLADELHRPDVDAELERRRGHERAQVAGAQARLGALAAIRGEAAVVRRDLVGAEPLAEHVREALGEPPRVHEHERRAVVADVLRDAVDDLAELLARWRPPRAPSRAARARPRARGGGPQSTMRWARRAATPVSRRAVCLDRALGRREADALGTAPRPGGARGARA